jgi:hypothetical protein
MRKTATKIIVGVGGAALLGGIGAGLAYADPTPTPTPPPTASASPTASPSTRAERKAERRADGIRPRPLLRRALHGEVTLAGKQHRVVAFQRGPIEAIEASSVTVRSEDGFTETYLIDDETKVRKGQGVDVPRSDLKPGDRVYVVALEDGSTLTAKRVRLLR